MKLEPLVTNRKVLLWLCLIPFDESISQRKKIAYITVGVTTMVAVFLILIASIVLFLRVIGDNLEISLYIVTQITGYASAESMILTGVLLRHKIFKIIDSLREIYSACKK